MQKLRRFVASIDFNFSVRKQAFTLPLLVFVVAKVSHLALDDSFFNFSIFVSLFLFFESIFKNLIIK